MKWGGACQSSPVFHMAITPAQIRKTYLVLYLYPAGSNPRFRLSLPGQVESTICPSYSFLVCEITFLVPICVLCIHVYCCLWDLPHTREIPPNFYFMMSQVALPFMPPSIIISSCFPVQGKGALSSYKAVSPKEVSLFVCPSLSHRLRLCNCQSQTPGERFLRLLVALVLCLLCNKTQQWYVSKNAPFC